MTVLFIENKYFKINVDFPRHHSYCHLLVLHMRDSQKLDVRRKKIGKENYRLFVNVQDFYYKLQFKILKILSRY